MKIPRLVLALAIAVASVFAASSAVAASRSHAASARQPAVAERDWKAIRQVIEAQRDALIAGQGAKAFGFATAPVRRQFGNARGFLSMVREDYAPLLEARYTEFLEGAVIDGLVVQPLRLVLPDDTVLVALYSMEKQRDGRWRIAGCIIAPSNVQST